jgi:nucleoside 2-deoxyribosyltransferase
MRAKRADSLFGPGNIINEIWALVRDAKVLVAELTDKSPNVFYELGLAHALGKPVVMLSWR